MSEWQPDPNGISQVLELATMALVPTRYQETLDVRCNLGFLFYRRVCTSFLVEAFRRSFFYLKTLLANR